MSKCFILDVKAYCITECDKLWFLTPREQIWWFILRHRRVTSNELFLLSTFQTEVLDQSLWHANLLLDLWPQHYTSLIIILSRRQVQCYCSGGRLLWTIWRPILTRPVKVASMDQRCIFRYSAVYQTFVYRTNQERLKNYNFHFHVESENAIAVLLKEYWRILIKLLITDNTIQIKTTLT